MTFQDLELRKELLRAVEQLGFETPTPIQEATIPFVLTEQKDMVALAQTGTGKTAAFGLPLLQTIASLQADMPRQTLALVLAPTRELCLQIKNDIVTYAQYLKQVKVVAVYGGEDIRKQLYQLDSTPQIIVATPGRLIDLMKRGKIRLQNLQFLVLDEADEMLDMGFQDDLNTILASVPAERRTMLFSATMPREVEQIAKQYMREYETIQIGTRNAGTENVDHVYFVCKAEDRYLVLKRIVDLNPDIYAIVFCRTKADTQEVAERLIKDGYNADALHGDLSQVARDNVMQRFRLHGVQLLVATDVAARGLDVHDLTHVINYQLPDDPEVYTHRSGRTGRANKRGISVSIVHQREQKRISTLQKMIHREFRRAQIPSGLEVCKKQLFYYVSRMQNVEVDEEQIQQYIPEVVKMLDYLSKEELIKRFVSIEFNRFLEYYKDAKDLNVAVESRQKGTDARLKAQGSKGGVQSSKFNAQRSEESGRKPKSRRMVRLKVNVGLRDGMNPKRFLALVNETTRDRTIHIADIDIAKNYTFFSVYPDQCQKVIKSFGKWEDLTIAEVKGKR